jgi:hypothetical protein
MRTNEKYRNKNLKRYTYIILILSFHLRLNHSSSLFHSGFCTKILLKKVKDKVIRVTGCGRPYDFETSRLPHFVDKRFTDGGEVVSLTHRPPFTPQEDSWYLFLLEAESTPEPLCGWKY